MYLTQIEAIIKKAVDSEVLTRCRVIIAQNEQLTKDNKMLMEQVSRLNNKIRELQKTQYQADSRCGYEELSEEQAAQLDEVVNSLIERKVNL